MENTRLLFHNNNLSDAISRKIKNNLTIKNRKYYYRIKTDIFEGSHIFEIIALINYINTKYKVKLPILIDIGNVVFADKLVYIVLETIIHFLLSQKYKINIIYHIKPEIRTEGIANSPLLLLDNKKLFYQKYKSNLNMHHFRELVPNKSIQSPDFLSKIMEKVNYFLKNNSIDTEVVETLSEVLVELVGNAVEHGSSECILDIDIADDYYKNDDTEQTYYGLNVVVLNYSPVLFYELLKNKIQKGKVPIERYDYIYEARKFHLAHLSPNYDENDFYTISSFQHRISGSNEKDVIGGTGLTRLINSLEEYADNHYCYMCSANKILKFEKKYMNYDKDDLIGFNEDSNYLSATPSFDIIGRSDAFIPGVGYNLNYVIKKGGTHE